MQARQLENLMHIAVANTGYVGLPLACPLADAAEDGDAPTLAVLTAKAEAAKLFANRWVDALADAAGKVHARGLFGRG